MSLLLKFSVGGEGSIKKDLVTVEFHFSPQGVPLNQPHSTLIISKMVPRGFTVHL